MLMAEAGPLQEAIAYHERTKHHLKRYARSPGSMDWANQPSPFRQFEGAPRVRLDRPEPGPEPRLDAVYRPGSLQSAALDRRALSQLMFDALALSAWKRFGNDRWSLRCNPSSGNLHPTEGYLGLPAIEGVTQEPAISHYCPFDHALERRFELSSAEWSALTEALPDGCLLVGLSSIHWREAWKYGERAFRYCQHDVGHAIAQLAYAAAALGWHVRLLEGVGDDALATLLGIDRQAGIEAEHPDALLCVAPVAPKEAASRTWAPGESVMAQLRRRDPEGVPNLLSAEPRSWKVIDEVAEACRRPGGATDDFFNTRSPGQPPDLETRSVSARQTYRTRRSAVAMDPREGIEREAFLRMLQRLMPVDAVPWASFPWRPRVHPLLLVHRVSGLAPGMYLLWRDPDRAGELQSAMKADLAWERVCEAPEGLPLFRLAEGDAGRLARTINCHQEIASDGAFAVEMLAEFEASLRAHGNWVYRRLHWEAGALGQVLYLEAEAAGVRGTGIGCFFDDVVHDVLGITDRRLQMLYGFPVGTPVEDPRLSTEPTYRHLGADDPGVGGAT
jgi:SagB-type dehydrogenase family enzyme